MESSAQRSKNMRAIHSKDSKIERTLRKALWEKGLRYRKNYAKLPGKPDIVFVRKKIAIFCDGEFWHGYNWNERKKDFKSHQQYWIPKIERNMARDEKINLELEKLGYTVLRFWGREILHDIESCVEEIYQALYNIL